MIIYYSEILVGFHPGESMSQIDVKYKDRLFTFIFGQEENRAWTLSLYNAVNGSHYTDPKDIQINTIKEVIYLGMHNDVSFIIADELNLYEQQSSYNPNMPLRQMQYVSLLFESYISSRKLNKFGKTRIHLPTPKLIVFYNGLKDTEDETILKLSDSFSNDVQADIEVRVRMLNINHGKNKTLMDSCRPLMEYSWIINEIRLKAKLTDIKSAVDAVIDNLPDDFVLKPFLIKHKVEVGTMLLTEYNEDEVHELFKEEGRQEGRQEGKQEGMIEFAAQMVKDKLLSITEAAKKLNLSEDDFIKCMHAITANHKVSV